MTDAIQFPHDVLGAAEVMFHPQLVSRSGGVSVTGNEQIVQSSAGRWSASLSFNIRTGLASGDRRPADRILVWRALLAALEGRSNILKIGPYDDLNTPAGIAGTRYGGLTPHADDSEFSDGSEYAQPQTPARVAASYLVGATVIAVDMLAGHRPEAGQYFSVLDRLFSIKRADETDVANRWNLTVWPPARDAVTDDLIGAELSAEFDRPQCQMRFATDETGQLALRQPSRGTAKIDLVEAV